MAIIRLIRREEVERRAAKSRSSIYRGIRAGTFPAPVRVGRRAVAWSEAEIEAWIASRPRASVGRADG